MTNAEVQDKIEVLKTLFPRLWARPGADFSPAHKHAIWVSAESSELIEHIDGIGPIEVSMFDLDNDQYPMGVHPKVDEVLNVLGLWAEFYDSGTVMLYSNRVL